MDADDKTERDTLKVTDDDSKAPPRDRDQSAISPERAQDKADRAEFSPVPEAQDNVDPGEPLIARDNMQGSPPRAGSSPPGGGPGKSDTIHPGGSAKKR